MQRKGGLDGSVLAPECLLVRYFLEGDEDRLLLVNWGRDLALDPAPEPLLAPPSGRRWRTLWSSEDPRYGGSGTPELDMGQSCRVPGHAAVVLAPVAEEAGRG
jgi:maltooligosyltrehalose trehalohydrolase